jgi:hypothetical protein
MSFRGTVAASLRRPRTCTCFELHQVTIVVCDGEGCLQKIGRQVASTPQATSFRKGPQFSAKPVVSICMLSLHSSLSILTNVHIIRFTTGSGSAMHIQEVVPGIRRVFAPCCTHVRLVPAFAHSTLNLQFEVAAFSSTSVTFRGHRLLGCQVAHGVTPPPLRQTACLRRASTPPKRPTLPFSSGEIDKRAADMCAVSQLPEAACQSLPFRCPAGPCATLKKNMHDACATSDLTTTFALL